MKPLVKIFRVLDELRKQHNTMCCHTAAVLIYIAMHPGSTTADIAAATGLAQASISRNTMELGKMNRRKQPGMNLVSDQEDPTERRRKIYFLTPKGQRVVASLIQTMEDAPEAASL